MQYVLRAETTFNNFLQMEIGRLDSRNMRGLDQKLDMRKIPKEQRFDD
jgi:hypothetical protein